MSFDDYGPNDDANRLDYVGDFNPAVDDDDEGDHLTDFMDETNPSPVEDDE